MKTSCMGLVLSNFIVGPGYYNQHSQFELLSKKKDDEEKSTIRNEQEILTFLKSTPIGFNARAERFKINLPIQEAPGKTK